MHWPELISGHVNTELSINYHKIWVYKYWNIVQNTPELICPSICDPQLMNYTHACLTDWCPWLPSFVLRMGHKHVYCINYVVYGFMLPQCANAIVYMYNYAQAWAILRIIIITCTCSYIISIHRHSKHVFTAHVQATWVNSVLINGHYNTSSE